MRRSKVNISQSQKVKIDTLIKPVVLTGIIQSIDFVEFLPPIHDEDEEYDQYDKLSDQETLDNVKDDDVRVIPPSKFVSFYVIGKHSPKVFTTLSSHRSGYSEKARIFATALQDVLHEREVSVDTVRALKGVLKRQKAIGESMAGQIWAKSYVYFQHIDTLVPVSYFLGGSGRRASKVDSQVVGLLIKYKDEIEKEEDKLSDVERQKPKFIKKLIMRIVSPEEKEKISHINEKELFETWQEVKENN